MRIYTRTGDDGTTGLLGPGRVFKDAARVEACGSVDELNAVLGVVRTLDLDGWLAAELATIQARLFHVGAELHVARALCRRAERRTVALVRIEPVELRLVRYLNRLGDLLFVMARWCNRRAGVPETEWRPRRP